MKSEKDESSPQYTIAAHDTLQRLNYTKRLAFDTLWESKDTISIDIKPIEKRHILGDKVLESIIKTRPKKYMTPSVSIDDIQDTNMRKLMISYMYKTTTSHAMKEVWNDIEIQSPCLMSNNMTEKEKSLTDEKVISHLPTRFQRTARKWDSIQNRSFLIDDTCYDTKNKSQKTKDITEIFICGQPEINAELQISEKEYRIRKLINENKLSIAYDKLPSYKGYRPYIAKGVPLEEKRND